MNRIRYGTIDPTRRKSSFDAFVVYQLPVPVLMYNVSPSFGRVLRAIAASQKEHLSPWIKQNRIPNGI